MKEIGLEQNAIPNKQDDVSNYYSIAISEKVKVALTRDVRDLLNLNEVDYFIPRF